MERGPRERRVLPSRRDGKNEESLCTETRKGHVEQSDSLRDFGRCEGQSCGGTSRQVCCRVGQTWQRSRVWLREASFCIEATRRVINPPRGEVRVTATPDPNAVFINVPFDSSYESLFVTLVGSLVFLGQEPHCVLEVREKGDGRLIRIVELMRTCRMSIHDLSRTGTPVRFNMPFELGLACSLKVAHPAAYEVFVLDSRPYRIDQTLSDYKGRDPLIHGGTCDGMVACLIDTLKLCTSQDIAQQCVARFLKLVERGSRGELTQLLP
jgi:hypothetical protein